MLLFDSPVSPAALLLLALSLDGALGEPRWLWGRIGHPVAWLGRGIAWLDRHLNREGDSPRRRLALGAATAAAVVVGAAALGFGVALLAAHLPLGWLLEAVVVAILLSFRSLFDHVDAVADGLQTGLNDGRRAVSHIVGRDPDQLDEAGVARAAVESLAENFVDGVVAPAFWYLLLGLPGLLAYKAINTLDSQIGHRTPRHDLFGRVAARTDDAVNWLPARLGAALICLAAVTRPGLALAGLRAAWRHAHLHRSVNAGWPEAAMAGVLDLRLAGPRWYDGTLVPDAWMGDGRREATPADIRAALRTYLVAGLVLAGVVLLVAFGRLL